MKSSIVVLVAFVIAGAAIYASSGLWAAPATEPEPVESDGRLMYGHIESLTPRGDGFEMQFDPAWWLNGETASRAALEDTGSRDVPNDYYIVEEGHRLLTYLVPATARVSVLTGGGPETTAIQVSELARMVNDEQPRAGFWILVDHRYPSPVLSLDQQYQP